MLSATLVAALTLLAPSEPPVPWPVFVDVKITCGTLCHTARMKVDTGSSSIAMSRSDAQTAGLLNAAGGKADPNLFGPDINAGNANGNRSTYYKTKPCTVAATDSFGNVCTASVGIVVPSQGGPNINNLLGTSFLNNFRFSSPANSCKIEWQPPQPVPNPPKKKESSVPTQVSLPSERARMTLPGDVHGTSLVWTYGTASEWTVLGDQVANQLGLSGTPFDLQATDPDYFATLQSTGFLGDDPSIPFEVVTIDEFGIVATDGSTLRSELGRTVLINRQSDENILSQDAIDELPAMAETHVIGGLDKAVFDLGQVDQRLFGAGTPHEVGIPQIGTTGLPFAGNAGFAVTGAGLSSQGAALLILGNRLATPAPVGTARSSSGLLLVSADNLIAMPADANGFGAVALPVPVGLCAELSFQIFDPGTSGLGLSRGLTAYIR